MKTTHTLLLATGLVAGLAFGSSEAVAGVPIMAPGVLATNGGASIEQVVIVRRHVVVRRPVAHRRVVR